eukprot:TRINITY_DN1055_c1_g1_i1.p1 TRINITY_DN1055_c1_g1~~TRINITY_DN1055_c1_g1_i1.p1  ORF type:complete len:420 (+),score=153.41 TRINITY_DN1055_c1_g1_i1:66-1262(+)
MALASEEMLRIDQGRRVHDKYVDAMDDLSLVAHVGDSRYGDLPQTALERMRQSDDVFHTDISEEMTAIEERLQRRQLENVWIRESDEGTQALSTEEAELAMTAWVDEQMAQRASTVSCRLPASSPPRGSQGAAPRVQLGTGGRVQAPAGLHDVVAVSGQHGEVVKRSGDTCEVLFDDGSTALMQASVCEVVERAHPAKAILSKRQSSGRRPYSGTSSGSKTGRESELQGLFSRAGQVSSPGFLKPGTQRELVEQKRNLHRSMIPAKHETGATPKRSRSKLAGVQPRYMKVHERVGPSDHVIEKEAGELLAVVFHPETLVVDDDGESFAEMRGKRITHVGCAEPPFTSSDEVHNAAAVRQQLSKARGSTVLAIRVEPWSQRRAVEKKRREFQERLATKG